MMSVATADKAFTHYCNFYFHRLGMMLLMTITGNPVHKSGIGKSYSAIRIAEEIDPDYREGTKALVKIVHTEADFYKAMEYIEKKGTKGQVIIIDEAGLLVNARKWQSMINTSVNDVVMTFRTLKCMAIFVTPILGSIDKTVRNYTNIWAMSEKALKDGKPVVRIRPYVLHWDMEDSTKFTKRFIRMYVRDQGRVCQFKYFDMDMPHNKELLDAYEAKAQKFKEEVRSQGKAQLEEDMNIDEWIDSVSKTEDLIHESRGKRRVYGEDIRLQYNISRGKADMIARKVNAKLNKGKKSDHHMKGDVIDV